MEDAPRVTRQALKRKDRDSADKEDNESGMSAKRRSIASVVEEFSAVNAGAQQGTNDINRELVDLEREWLESDRKHREQELALRRAQMESKERMFMAELKERQENAFAQREAARQQHDLLMRLLVDKLEK